MPANSTNPNPTEVKTQSGNKLVLYVALIVVALVFAVLSTNNSFRKLFSSENIQTREVVGKVFATFGEMNYVILKIKTETGIAVEFFEKPATGQQKLKQKFSLGDDTEAFLMINDNSTNLSLVDTDKDGELDIVVPTVDRNGNSRLNVFKYQADLNQFVPVTPEE